MVTGATGSRAEAVDVQNAGAHKMPPRAPILNLGLWDHGIPC